MKKQNSRIRQPKIGTPLMRMVILLVFAALIFLADFLLLADHGKTFSVNENRVLQQAPELTINSLSTGKFMSQEEDFVTDQFFLRDGWIGLKLLLDRISGKAESNNVYLGKQGYLLEKPVLPNETYLSRNLEAINAFADNYDLSVVMTLVPGAAWVCDQFLPNQAPVENVDSILADIQARLSSRLTYVDVTNTLRTHKNEELYYKSDHHWKSLGAKYAFETMASALGIDTPVTDYAIMTVANDFAGTMASNSGATYVKDTIEIYVPLPGGSSAPAAQTTDSGDISVAAAAAGSTTGDLLYGNRLQAEKALASSLEYVVEYTDTTQKTATIYDSSALEQKDKYQVFLGGNHPLINIKTNQDNGRNLLLLKDSYANTMVQFLLPYYSSVTIVDPRYYSEDLGRLLDNNQITEVLILYSENNFVTDNSLFGVLEDLLPEMEA